MVAGAESWMVTSSSTQEAEREQEVGQGYNPSKPAPYISAYFLQQGFAS